MTATLLFNGLSLNEYYAAIKKDPTINSMDALKLSIFKYFPNSYEFEKSEKSPEKSAAPTEVSFREFTNCKLN